MTLLTLGLVLFLGMHLLPTVPAARGEALAKLGEQRYKGMFALVSGIGFTLIVVGFARSGPREPLFTPVPAAIAIAPYAVTLALILFAAANMRGYIRKTLRHPMLTGLLIWSTVHLLANGDRAGTLLFGAFLAYALIDLASAIQRGAVKSFEPEARFDAMAIGGGIVVALLFMTFHRYLFGVPAVSFSL